MCYKNYCLAVIAAMFVFCGMTVFGQEKPMANSNEIYARLEALTKEKNHAGIQQYITDLQEKYSLSPADGYWVKVFNSGVKAGADLGAIAYVIPPETMSQEERSKIHFKVAKLFMHLRDYKKADYYGRTTPAPVPSYQVTVVEEAPIGVYGWKNSAIVKDPAKRENRFANYNEAGAAVLFTDVNANRTAAAVTKKADKCGVSFFVAADARGISCYVENMDKQKDEVMAGLAYGGMLEMYFQPGFDHVYYQWL